MKSALTTIRGRVRAVFVMSVLALPLVACGDDGTPDPSQNPMNNGTTGTNNGTTETNNGTTGTNNGTTGTNNQTTCEPDATCVTCGVFDDGCGGTLDCGPCPCVNGVKSDLVGVACGACDLGTYTCGPNETGIGSCEMPIPGIESLTCDDIVFVLGGVGGDGSKISPLNDVLEAVALAKSTDRHLVVVGDQNTYSMDGPLELVEGIHIIGGFDSSFVPSPSNKPVLINNKDSYEHLFAARAIELGATTYLKNVELRTTFAANAGENTYGLWAYRANGLVLTNVTLAPGRGGVGERGADGIVLPDFGNRGAPGWNGYFRPSSPTGTGGWPRVGPALMWAPNGCNDLPEYSGGIGGTGAGYPASGSASNLLAATAGTRWGGGGVGGLPGVNFTATSLGTSGQDGADGMAGSISGDEGSAGAGMGSMKALYFERLGAGGDGGVGEPGRGGAGGGGAGAYNIATGGQSGGGGGGGGCGGGGGKGGGAGGSSFALVLLDSVGFSYTELELKAGPGGIGGGGGQGHPGALGGTGGASSNELLTNNGLEPKTSAIHSGAGGDGGKGARGGHGGGGAGGHSIGVWCDGPTSVDQMVKVSNAGGVGGFSYTPSSTGAVGLSLMEYGCRP